MKVEDEGRRREEEERVAAERKQAVIGRADKLQKCWSWAEQ